MEVPPRVCVSACAVGWLCRCAVRGAHMGAQVRYMPALSAETGAGHDSSHDRTARPRPAKRSANASGCDVAKACGAVESAKT